MELQIVGCSVAPFGTASSAYLVTAQKTTVLLDCGAGAFERLWRQNLLRSIDAIVISHMHHDHMIDLWQFVSLVVSPEIRAQRSAEHRNELIDLYVPRDRGPTALAELSAVLTNDRRSDGALNIRPVADTKFSNAFKIVEYDQQTQLEIGDLKLTFALTAHAEACFAPRVTDGVAVLAYTADSGPDDALAEHAKDADLLLAEATYFDGGPTVKPDHMTGRQAGELARRAGVGQLVVTHLGAVAHENDARRREAAQEFPGTVHLAHEGAVYQI